MSLLLLLPGTAGTETPTASTDARPRLGRTLPLSTGFTSRLTAARVPPAQTGYLTGFTYGDAVTYSGGVARPSTDRVPRP